MTHVVQIDERWRGRVAENKGRKKGRCQSQEAFLISHVKQFGIYPKNNGKLLQGNYFCFLKYHLGLQCKE